MAQDDDRPDDDPALERATDGDADAPDDADDSDPVSPPDDAPDPLTPDDAPAPTVEPSTQPAQTPGSALPAAGRERISDIVVECDVPYCDDLRHVETLVEVTGLWVGQELDRGRVERARRRLVQTGFFAKVDASLEPDRNGTVVRFATIGQPLVREVKFHETGGLFDSDLKKWLFLRGGRPLTPRPVTITRLTDAEREALTLADLSRLALDDQQEALERVYEREGFYDARVQIWTEVVEPYLIDLHVDVEPGPAYVLGRIYVRGHKHFDYDVIEREIRGAFGFFKNFSREQLNEGVDALIERYRRDGFIGVRISKQANKVPEREVFDVYLDIDEGRRWRIEFQGNRALDRDELSEALTFFDTGFVDDSEIASSIIELEARYETAGHYWATIRPQRDFDDATRTHVLTFVIDEGPRSEIDRIEFEGNHVFSDDELLELIQSRPFQAFGSGAFPQRSLIANDANLLVAAYQDRGYLAADVPGWRLEPLERDRERLVLTFEIVEGPRTVVRSLGTTAPPAAQPPGEEVLEAGVRTLVDDAVEALILQTGTGFSVQAVGRDLVALRRPLVGEGYARAEVRASCQFYRGGQPVTMLVPTPSEPPTEEVLDPADGALDEDLDPTADSSAELLDEPAPSTTVMPAAIAACAPPQLPAGCLPADPAELCETFETPSGGLAEVCRRTRETAGGEPGGASCSLDSRATDTVDVRYEVRPGLAHEVGPFFIHGNFVTADWVVRQDFPFDTGDPLDLDGLLKARGQLRSRAIYDSVIVNTIGLEDADPEAALLDVPIVIYIEEGSRRWIDLYLGLTLIATEFFGELGIEFVEANLFGTGAELSLAFLPVFRFLNLAGEFVLTRNFNQDWFTLLTLKVPIAPVSGVDLLVQAYYDLRYIPDPQLEEQGVVVELRWDISRELFLSTALEAKLSATRRAGDTIDEDALDLCFPVVWGQDCGFGPRLQTYSIVLPRIFYNARNNLLNPTDGYVFDGRLKFAFTEDVGFYIKPDLRGTLYHTFLRNFTLALNGRVGMAILLETSDALPAFERFFLGGINMRGFELDAVGPRRVETSSRGGLGETPLGGEFLLNLNAELRVPIVRDLGLYGVIFVDTGTLLGDQFLDYDSAEAFFTDLFVDELRVTAGLGLRFLLAENLPPIIIDYGILLNRRLGEPFGGSHINIGYTF